MKKQTVVIGMSLVMTFALLGGVLYYYSQPQVLPAEQRQQAIEQVLGHKPRTEGEKSGISTYEGRLMRFIYPAQAIEKQGREIPKETLEYVSLMFQDPRSNIVVTVTHASGSLAEISGVLHRRKEKARYRETTQLVAGNTALIFTKERDGYEQTAFFMVNERFYTIARKSAIKPDDDVFLGLLRSFTVL